MLLTLPWLANFLLESLCYWWLWEVRREDGEMRGLPSTWGCPEPPQQALTCLCPQQHLHLLACRVWRNMGKSYEVEGADLKMTEVFWFCGLAWGMWNFRGQGSNPSHSRDNAGSLTCWAARELLKMTEVDSLEEEESSSSAPTPHPPFQAPSEVSRSGAGYASNRVFVICSLYLFLLRCPLLFKFYQDDIPGVPYLVFAGGLEQEFSKLHCVGNPWQATECRRSSPTPRGRI